MDTWFPTFRRILSKRLPLPIVRPRPAMARGRRALLRLIAVSIEEKLPLSPLLEAWAEDERGAQRYRLGRLAQLLDQGTPLADALEQIPGILRDEEILAVRFDAQSGTRATSVRETLAESQPALFGGFRPLRNTMMYFCFVLVLAFPVVAFTQIKVVPEMNKIQQEFDIETPALEWPLRFNALLSQYWWLAALVLLVLLWLTFSAWPGRFVRYTLLGRCLRPIRDLHAADLLRKISIAIEAGRPIPGALSTLARYHFDPAIRHKLLFVRNEVEQGADVWQSMGAVELLTQPEIRVLATAKRIGNQPWVLRRLACGKSRRSELWLQRTSELLLPIVVIAMGAFVLLQALSIFLLLTECVHGLA